MRVYGDALPRTTLGFFYLLWAIVHSLYLACVIVFGQRDRFDVLVVDQLSVSIPILRLSRAKVRLCSAPRARSAEGRRVPECCSGLRRSLPRAPRRRRRSYSTATFRTSC